MESPILTSHFAVKSIFDQSIQTVGDFSYNMKEYMYLQIGQILMRPCIMFLERYNSVLIVTFVFYSHFCDVNLDFSVVTHSFRAYLRLCVCVSIRDVSACTAASLIPLRWQ